MYGLVVRVLGRVKYTLPVTFRGVSRTPLVAMLALAGCDADGQLDPPTCEPPILIGHRGTPNYRPENTMPAFDWAMASGGHGVEIDVQRTLDGHLVAMHDTSIARTTNGGDRRVSELGLEELQALDAGGWFHPDYAGTRVPTLHEIVDTLDANYEAPLYVFDMKYASMIEPTAAFIEERGLGERGMLAVRSIEEVERVCATPNAPTAILFLSSFSQIPDHRPACLEIMRLPGGTQYELENVQKVTSRGYHALVGGWKIHWGYTRYSIADNIKDVVPWLEDQIPPECIEQIIGD